MMNRIEAERIIESLRTGIPPEGKVSLITVGRYSEIIKIQEILKIKKPQSFLIEANYGSGKSHLLKLINELSLNAGFVTSLIILDAQSSSRFNRMDQIFGQVCRNIQIPNSNSKSIRYLFDALFRKYYDKKVNSDLFLAEELAKETEFIRLLSNNGKWDFSEYLNSPSIFIALRAWFLSYTHNHQNINQLDDLIEDWLFNNHIYSINRKKYLYSKLVRNLDDWFTDPRYEREFYRNNIFSFQAEQYNQSWTALQDLNTLTKAAGFKGFIILVDEFEDVIYNLNNITWQQVAFRNLFHFFSLKKFSSISFFAVTPAFAHKCKKLLQEKEIQDFNYSTFNDLTKFKVEILSSDELIKLCDKIIPIHEIAYDWDFDSSNRKLVHSASKESASLPIEFRVRQTIKSIVKVLDDCLEEKN